MQQQNTLCTVIANVLLRACAQPRKAPNSFVVSVRLSTCTGAAPTGRITVKFDIGILYGNLSRKSKFGQNRGNILGTLHDGFIVVSDIKPPHTCSLRGKRYQAVMIAEEV